MKGAQHHVFSTAKLAPVAAGKRGVVLLACGSFSPVTNMHLRIFEDARAYFQTHDKLGLQVVGGYLSPVTDAYKKKGLVAAHHRVNMCDLAVESSDWLMVDRWESSQEEFVRTQIAMDYFDNQLNGTKSEEDRLKVMLLCGSDLLDSFNTPGLWADEDLEIILGKYGVVCIKREGSDPTVSIKANPILSRNQHNIHIVPVWIPNDISSTRIRNMLAQNISVKYFLPDPVISYIRDNSLYTTPAQ